MIGQNSELSRKAFDWNVVVLEDWREKQIILIYFIFIPFV